MLSDEEKEAIEWLKRLVKINKRDNLDNTFAEILLNLIEKQSKEIDDLKLMIGDEKTFIQFGEIIGEKKVKDKIKAKTIEIKNRPVKDEFITASQGKLNTIIDMESLLEKE